MLRVKRLAAAIDMIAAGTSDRSTQDAALAWLPSPGGTPRPFAEGYGWADAHGEVVVRDLFDQASDRAVAQVLAPLAVFVLVLCVWLFISYVLLEPRRQFLMPPPQNRSAVKPASQSVRLQRQWPVVDEPIVRSAVSVQPRAFCSAGSSRTR